MRKRRNSDKKLLTDILEKTIKNKAVHVQMYCFTKGGENLQNFKNFISLLLKILILKLILNILKEINK